MAPPKYSLFQCIGKVFGIIAKYPFSIFLLALVAFTIVIVIYGKKIKSSAPKVIVVLSWITIAIATIFKYSQSLEFVKNTLKAKTFTSIYFPNLITYICMLLISFFFFFKGILKKESSILMKAINTFAFTMIGVNFFLILRETFIKNITIYDPVTIYQNENLQSLIQTSTWIFVFWMLALAINVVAHFVTNRLDKLAVKNANGYNQDGKNAGNTMKNSI